MSIQAASMLWKAVTALASLAPLQIDRCACRGVHLEPCNGYTASNQEPTMCDPVSPII